MDEYSDNEAQNADKDVRESKRALFAESRRLESRDLFSFDCSVLCDINTYNC